MEAIFKAYVSSKSLSKDKNISKSATLEGRLSKNKNKPDKSVKNKLK